MEFLFLKKRKLLFFSIAAVLIASSIATAYSALTATVTMTSTGRISTSANIGVYKDNACTQPLSAIDWGNLTVGATANSVIYVKNTGTVRQTVALSATGWAPSAAGQYLTITWDQNNTALNANQVVRATVRLAVAANVGTSITTFSNNITITGST